MTSSQSLETPPPSRCRYWDTFTGKKMCVPSLLLVLILLHVLILTCLYSSLNSKTDRVAKGAECFQRSLTLNPFLWSPFQNLCHLGNEKTHTHL